ncbi:MAG TPA: TetR/AcrR family transcriptional regulator, partial [Leptolinea sp.]
RHIARTVGINPATMYYYFPTKELLIESVVESAINRLGITAEELPGTPREQLHSHLFRIYHKMRDEPGLFAVFSEIQMRSGRTSTSQKFIEYENVWHAKLVKLLQTGIRQGYWPNYMEPEVVATTIITLMQGAGLQASTQPRRIENSINQLERWLISR